MTSLGVSSPNALITSIFLASAAGFGLESPLAASAAALKSLASAALKILIASSRIAAALASADGSLPVMWALAYQAMLTALDLIPAAAFFSTAFFLAGAALSTASAALVMTFTSCST